MTSAEKRADGLRKAMEGMVDTLDKKHMRQLQKDSFMCQAKCCDTAPSQTALQQCCSDCEQRVIVANQLINTSIREFQDRLQRCVQRCQDKAQEQLSAQPVQKEIEKVQVMLSECAADCAVEYEKQIPKLHKDTVQRLQQFK